MKREVWFLTRALRPQGTAALPTCGDDAPMRAAFIDLLFSWPPHGGADVDVYHIAKGMAALGHDAKLFGVRSATTWERGDFDPTALPFPATRIDFPKGLHRNSVALIHREVDAWRPDAIYIGDSFFLKPALINAFASYPILARFYAHELLCHKDILRFRDGEPCPNDYLRTPDTCRECGLRHQSSAIKSGPVLAWTEEYLAAEAWRPDYYRETLDALKLPAACICYNEGTASLLRPYALDSVVIPGGVDVTRFPFAPPPANAVQQILMAGRGEDPVKGAGVLIEACRLLSEHRKDFHLLITMPETTPHEEWFTPLPWCNHEEMVARYHAASICVAPSIWEEPFGMVALEAMACGRPVVVSDVGGLRDTIVDNISGLRFPRGDAAALAQCLATLLDDKALRHTMGIAARERVEQHFSWDIILRDHYIPLLQRLQVQT